MIHEDENNPFNSEAINFVSSKKIAIPIQSMIKGENSHKATKWNDMNYPVVSEVMTAPNQPKIQVPS